jgi:hypothetical protein
MSDAIALTRAQLDVLTRSAVLYRQAGVDVVCTLHGSGVDVEMRCAAPPAPEHLRAVDEYAASGSTEWLALPATLSSRDRATVHARATVLGLQHESLGEGDARHVRVRRV